MYTNFNLSIFKHILLEFPQNKTQNRLYDQNPLDFWRLNYFISDSFYRSNPFRINFLEIKTLQIIFSGDQNPLYQFLCRSKPFILVSLQIKTLYIRFSVDQNPLYLFLCRSKPFILDSLQIKTLYIRFSVDQTPLD